MHHFPASPRDSTSSSGLNATQRNAAADPMFSLIHDELHDARRVQKHGQEDDLRAALDMVIRRVESMSTQLSGALKSQAELEVQLNMAKSNLALVIANNEMLEEALKSSSGGNNELGWRRSSSSQRPQNLNRGHKDSMDSMSSDVSSSSRVPEQQPTGSSRFLRSFKIGGGSSGTVSNGNTRPNTPSAKGHVLSSPSMPSLPTHVPSPSPSITSFESKRLESEMEALRAELSASQAAHTSLEEELESLSQALFEEANKMVKVERIKRAEMEEELNEVRQEREALRSALKVMGQKEANLAYEDDMKADQRTLKRSSSRAAVKSPPPDSPSPEPDEGDTTVVLTQESASSSEKEVASTLTARSESTDSSFSTPPSSFASPPLTLTEEPSPWADVPSSPARQENDKSAFVAASTYSSR